jgi:hypothetical protein
MDSTTLLESGGAAADPIAGELGSHDLSLGMGRQAITAAGAIIGAADEAEPCLQSTNTDSIHPQDEDAYWRDHYRSRPYYRPGRFYFDYQPAYRYGWETALGSKYQNKCFAEVEEELAQGWAGTGLKWRDWREAVHDAWNHARREGET